MAMIDDNVSFGMLLQMFRRRQHFTQQVLAASLGVHRRTLIRWEQGDYLPESKTMVLELAKHLHLNDQETCQLLESSLTALAPHWLVSLPRNPFFTGREGILEALHRQLSSDGQVVALTQSLALRGLGGVGKTQIALEYAIGTHWSTVRSSGLGQKRKSPSLPVCCVLPRCFSCPSKRIKISNGLSQQCSTGSLSMISGC